MLPMYSTVKSTHLYSLAGNFLIWRVPTPYWSPTGRVEAGLLGAQDRYSLEIFRGKTQPAGTTTYYEQVVAQDSNSKSRSHGDAESEEFILQTSSQNDSAKETKRGVNYRA